MKKQNRVWHLYGPHPIEGDLPRTMCKRVINDLGLKHRLYIMPPKVLPNHTPCQLCHVAYLKSKKDATL